MPYATLQDLERRFGEREITQLADRNLDGTNDLQVVDDALMAASSEMDSYLGARYEIPIMSISDNLNRTCCDIARYLLHENAAIEEVEKRYKRAIAWLTELARGKAVLTDAGGAVITETGKATGGVRSFSSRRQFTDVSMRGF